MYVLFVSVVRLCRCLTSWRPLAVLNLDLHSIGIVHADIKPDNIVFKSSAVVNLLPLDVGGGFKSKVRLENCRSGLIPGGRL